MFSNFIVFKVPLNQLILSGRLPLLTKFWPKKHLFTASPTSFIGFKHRYRSAKNRLLKFCYVPATSAAHNRLLFFSFLLQLFTVLMKKTHAVKQSIYS